MQELHSLLPPRSVAVHCRSSTTRCPQAVWGCIAGLPVLGSDRLLGRVPRP